MTTFQGSGVWNFDTYPPRQILTDAEVDVYNDFQRPLPEGVELPDAEMDPSIQRYKEDIFAPAPAPTPIPRSYNPTPNLNIAKDIIFLRPTYSELRREQDRIIELEKELGKIKKSIKKKKPTPKKKKKKSTPKKKRSNKNKNKKKK